MKFQWLCWLFGHKYEMVYEAKAFGIFLCAKCGNGFTLHTRKIADMLEKESA